MSSAQSLDAFSEMGSQVGHAEPPGSSADACLVSDGVGHLPGRELYASLFIDVFLGLCGFDGIGFRVSRV